MIAVPSRPSAGKKAAVNLMPKIPLAVCDVAVDSSDPEMAKVLYAWSPYQNVRDDVRYPAMMIDCGSNDPRCPPWHSRKLAARMQQASNGSLPILLHVRAAAGHGAVGKTQKAHQSTEVLAFLAEQLWLTV